MQHIDHFRRQTRTRSLPILRPLLCVIGNELRDARQFSDHPWHQQADDAEHRTEKDHEGQSDRYDSVAGLPLKETRDGVQQVGQDEGDSERNQDFRQIGEQQVPPDDGAQGDDDAEYSVKVVLPCSIEQVHDVSRQPGWPIDRNGDDVLVRTLRRTRDAAGSLHGSLDPS